MGRKKKGGKKKNTQQKTNKNSPVLHPPTLPFALRIPESEHACIYDLLQ